MKVKVTWSGGYAGQGGEVGAVDTSAIDADEAARLEEVIEDLAANPDGGEIGADLYEYRIEVTTDQGVRTFTVSDPGDPQQPMDSRLTQLLRLMGAG